MSLIGDFENRVDEPTTAESHRSSLSGAWLGMEYKNMVIEEMKHAMCRSDSPTLFSDFEPPDSMFWVV